MKRVGIIIAVAGFMYILYLAMAADTLTYNFDPIKDHKIWHEYLPMAIGIFLIGLLIYGLFRLIIPIMLAVFEDMRLQKRKLEASKQKELMRRREARAAFHAEWAEYNRFMREDAPKFINTGYDIDISDDDIDNIAS